jgi:hypothetical protein
MTHPRETGLPATPKHLLAWRIGLTAVLLAAIALTNTFSEVSDYARFGDALPVWEPLVWEFSSVILMGALIPVVAWLLRRVPLDLRHWYRCIPIHLFATLPFSIAHVAGMVGLRKLAYALAGGSYHFGPVFSAWVYEYRKDFVTYGIIVAFLGTGSAWRYWRRVHAERLAAEPQPTAPPAGGVESLDRLVVRKLNREFILDVADIARLESSGNYVTVHARGATYQLRGSLAGLVQRLDPRRFVQIHRSQVVNVDHVREIQPWDHGDYRVVLDDGSLINFSRRYRARLEARFCPPPCGHNGSAAHP